MLRSELEGGGGTVLNTEKRNLWSGLEVHLVLFDLFAIGLEGAIDTCILNVTLDCY